jgi:hypothetical protein
MNADTKALADKAVDSFAELLDADTRAAVGDANLHALRDMVIEVINERSKSIIERLEQDLRQLESDMVERVPLEL